MTPNLIRTRKVPAKHVRGISFFAECLPASVTLVSSLEPDALEEGPGWLAQWALRGIGWTDEVMAVKEAFKAEMHKLFAS